MSRCSAVGRVLRLILITPLSGLNSNPVLFKGRSFQIVRYGVFAAMNTFLTASMLLFYLHTKGHGFKASLFLVLGFCWAGGAVGVKLFHVAALGRVFFKDVKAHMNQTAMYSQGGILGIFCSLVIVGLVENIPLSIILDGSAFGAVLGLACGRLGCYSYGCCFGKPTTCAFSVTYTHPASKVLRLVPDWKDTPLFPTQFYACYANLFLFVLFAVVARAFPFDGLVTLLFVVLYNGFRIIIEKYRYRSPGPDFRKTALGIGVVLLLLIVPYLALTRQIFRHTPFRYPMSIRGYLDFLASGPAVLVPILLVSFASLLFYGVHGKKLGEHLDYS